MRLEPRIERLEARVPSDGPVTDRIELVGRNNDVLPAVSRLEDGRWTPFEMAARR